MPHNNIPLLSQTFSIGKHGKGLYVKALVDTAHGYLTVWVKGRIFGGRPFRFLVR